MTAVDLTKRASVVLTKFSEAAEADPETWDVFQRAEIYLGVDHSGSMRRYFDHPRQPVLHLARQVCALGLARLDPDGRIPMWFYASDVQGPWEVTETTLWPEARRFRGAPDDVVTRAVREARYGSTRTDLVVREILRAHRRTDLSTPGLAIIQTDGVPDDRDSVINAIVEASAYNLFYVFVGYGPDGRRFLKQLNEGGFSRQVVDNVYAFDAGDDPMDNSDELVMSELLKEIPEWRKKANGRVQGTV